MIETTKALLVWVSHFHRTVCNETGSVDDDRREEESTYSTIRDADEVIG